MLRLWMICKVGCYCVRIMIYAGNNMGTLLTVNRCRFNAGAGSASPAEKVYV